MARTVEKLSALRVEKETKPGLYGDGCSLRSRAGKFAIAQYSDTKITADSLDVNLHDFFFC